MFSGLFDLTRQTAFWRAFSVRLDMTLGLHAFLVIGSAFKIIAARNRGRGAAASAANWFTLRRLFVQPRIRECV